MQDICTVTHKNNAIDKVRCKKFKRTDDIPVSMEMAEFFPVEERMNGTRASPRNPARLEFTLRSTLSRSSGNIAEARAIISKIAPTGKFIKENDKRLVTKFSMG